MIKILIIDEATFMRISLKNIFETNGLKVVGEASNYNESIRKCKELSPNVIVVGISYAKNEMLNLIKDIKKINQNTNVIACSALCHKQFVIDIVLAGADSFLAKPFSQDRMIQEVSAIIKR